MDFSFSTRQQELCAFAQETALFFDGSNEGGSFGGSSLWEKCARSGWPGLCIPEAFKGQGAGALDSVVAMEALGKAGANRSAMFALGAHLFGCAKAIDRFAPVALKDRLLPDLATGAKLGALALTEATGGSELKNVQTVLNGDGDGFRLSGEKTYVTNGTSADVFLVLAKVADRPAPFDLSVVVVEADPRVRRSAFEGAVGLPEAGMATVVFEDVAVPATHYLGRPGSGISVLLATMQWERSCILAGALGALARDFSLVREHLTERLGGLGFQAVSHELANLRQQIETTRLMMYRAAWELDQGGDALLYPALSKLTVSETLLDGAIRLQKLMAGAGWAGQFGLVQAVQDSMATCSVSGTSNVLRNLIATRLAG